MQTTLCLPLPEPTDAELDAWMNTLDAFDPKDYIEENYALDCYNDVQNGYYTTYDMR